MRSRVALMRSALTTTRRSVATGCCCASSSTQRSSSSRSRASIVWSSPITDCASCRSAVRSACPARFTADSTSRLISARSSPTCFSSASKISRIASLSS
ncbi:Uncharacterised protein [Mycobacteroides abscessus]|nr:Uncharacterised protein [Mycobacteroides abscessus]